MGQIIIIYEPWTCHELENFPSWITLAYSPMSLGVQGVMGHTLWTCGQNGKMGCKQTQLDHMKSVTEKLKAILPHYSVFVKILEPGIHLYM